LCQTRLKLSSEVNECKPLDVGDSMRRVMEMRRGAGEDVQLVVAAALLAVGDQGVFEAGPYTRPLFDST